MNNQKLVVLNELKFDAPKTKQFAETMKNLKINDKKTLFVTAENDQNVVRSGRNIKGVSIAFADVINTYDVINNEILVMTKDAVLRAQEVFI